VVGILRQHDAYHYQLVIIYLLIIHSLHIIYLLFSICSDSMREVSCGNRMPAIIILFIYSLFIIHYLVYAAAACARHPGAAGCLPLLST
jgi:hypothetical protein